MEFIDKNHSRKGGYDGFFVTMHPYAYGMTGIAGVKAGGHLMCGERDEVTWIVHENKNIVQKIFVAGIQVQNAGGSIIGTKDQICHLGISQLYYVE